MTTPERSQENEGELGAFGYRQELKRGLTLRDLLVHGLVFMVPIAPFSIFGGCSTRRRAWCRWSTSSGSWR